MFHRCEKRMQWDKSFFEMKVVDEIEGSDILYSVLRVPAVVATQSEHTVERAVEPEAVATANGHGRSVDGTILISLRSANHPELPETSKHVRAESFTSGYVMRRYDDGNEKGTKVFLMTCTDVKGIIPKWIINFVAPRKPGEWIDCLKRACLEYQASNPDYESLLKELEPFKEYHSFDFEDMDATVTHGKSGNEEATRILL
ncbi:StAR-related lipid transfer protein 7 [Durusdinium trenchii]|uniref:Mitochondrial (START domain-containing protein 7) (StARD7) n=1 Tax=Durusdinium trenchii TaxID=1381693 RepID=A0ABP0K5G7_9DINO